MTPPPSKSPPAGVRFGVWLLVLSSALIVLVAICLQRPSEIKAPESEPPADVTKHDVPATLPRKPRPVSASPEAPATEATQKTLTGWVLDLGSTNGDVVQAARRVLADMGADAAPAIPQLAQMLKEGRNCNAAAYTLAAIGTNALPVLIDALSNGNPVARMETAGAIGSPKFGEAGEAAIQALVKCMSDDDRGVRANAIAALQSIPKRPDIAVPALIAALADPDAHADTVLRKYAQVEPDATIPMLIQAAQQAQNPVSIRFHAAEIVRAIAPERAKAEGL
jgi:HEAT repeat protein